MLNLINAIALLSLASFAAAAGPVLNTPSTLTYCQPVQLTWSGGVSPWYITAIPGNEPAGTPLEQLGSFTTQSYTWTVNLPAGTFTTLQITDGSGAINYAAALTVLPGTCRTTAAGGVAKVAKTKAANKVAATGSAASGSGVHSKGGAHTSVLAKIKSASGVVAAAASSAAGNATAKVVSATSAVPTVASSATNSHSVIAPTVLNATSAAPSASATTKASGAKGRSAVWVGAVGAVGFAVACLV